MSRGRWIAFDQHAADAAAREFQSQRHSDRPAADNQDRNPPQTVVALFHSTAADRVIVLISLLISDTNILVC
jgi:hypothetical protein